MSSKRRARIFLAFSLGLIFIPQLLRASPDEESLDIKYARVLWSHFLQDTRSPQRIRDQIAEAQSHLREIGAPLFDDAHILISQTPCVSVERGRLFIPFVFFLEDQGDRRIALEWLRSENYPFTTHPVFSDIQDRNSETLQQILTQYQQEPLPRRWELFFLDDTHEITFQFRRIPELGGLVVPCRLDEYLESKIDGLGSFPREEIPLSTFLSEPVRFRIRALLRNTASLESRRSDKVLLGEGLVGFLLWMSIDRPLRYIARRSLRWPARVITFFGSFIVVDGVLAEVADRLGIEHGVRETYAVPRRHLEEVVFFLERSYEEARVGNLNGEQFQSRFYELLNREAEEPELGRFLESLVIGAHHLPIPPADSVSPEQYREYLQTLLTRIEEELEKVRMWGERLTDASEVTVAADQEVEGVRMIYEVYLPFFAQEESEWISSRLILDRLRGRRGRRIWILPQEYQQILLQLGEAQRRLESLQETYCGLLERWQRLSDARPDRPERPREREMCQGARGRRE